MSIGQRVATSGFPAHVRLRYMRQQQRLDCGGVPPLGGSGKLTEGQLGKSSVVT